MGNISIETNEKQLIRCLIEQPDLSLLIEEDMFQSEQASALYKTIEELLVRRVPITKEHLVSEGNRHSPLITAELIDLLMEQAYDLNSFITYYLPRLKKDFAKQEIQFLLKGEMRVVAESKGELDVEALRGHLSTIDQHLSLTSEKQAILYSAPSAAARYTAEILKRDRENTVWRTGCSHLDSYLTVGMPPKNITTLFGASGTGKSAYALYLDNKRINRRIPTIYISLEMDLISTFDRLCAMRRRMDMKNLYPSDGIIQEHVMSAVLAEMESLKRVKTFWFVEETGLCIKDVESLVKDAKRFMGVDSLNVTIDLLSMLRDFSGKDPSEYEDGVNLMFEMGKRLNIHQTWVLQANRKADSAHLTSIDQLHYLRPNRNTIKNSSEILNRSRICLSVFRPRFYAEQLFPNDPGLALIEDNLEIQMLKQSQGDAGEILKYRFKGSSFSITPIARAVNERAVAATIAAVDRPAHD